MKKNLLVVLISLFCLLGFVSCGNKLPGPDEFGFYNDMDSAKAAAKKSGKNILLYITMGGFDDESEMFTTEVLHSDEYKTAFSEKYVSVHFDFGAEAYTKSEPSHFNTEEEKKAASEYNRQITKNISLARVLDLQYTPVVFLMNRDGYAFADEEYSEAFVSVETLSALISEYEADFDILQEMVDDTKKGTPSEKMEKINKIYQLVEDKYVPTYTSLFKSVVQIDKKNESGLTSYLYFVYVMEESKKYSMAGDYASAINVFREAAQGNVLEGEEKQQAFYMAGQMMIMAGSNDYAGVLNFFNAAIQAAPETELAETTRQVVTQITNLLSASEDK